MTKTLRVGALASGGGSNIQSIIDHIESGKLHARIVILLSDHPEAGVLRRGERHGIPHQVINPDDFKNRQDHDRAMISVLKENEVDLVVLAG